MKTICFLSQFPPPMHGLSKAVDTLYNSRLKEKYQFEKIDITNNKRVLQSLWRLFWCKSDVVYFTPSQTKAGNMRDLLFLKIIQWKNKTCLAHIHGGYYRHMVDCDCAGWQRKANYKAVKCLAGGIVLGQTLRNIFEGMLPDEKIFVCPNCVDNIFVGLSLEKKLKDIVNGHTLQILYLSNFIETKGYRDVLKLARMAQERGDADKYIFHFAGKFFEKAEMEYFKKYGSDLQNMVYHGVVSGKDKINLLNQCHILVLLSRYPNEGQPISILEAMGNGMAVITTDHAGIPEIASQDNGYVCSKLNIDLEDIYEYLREINNDRRKLSEICQNNYDVTRQKYTEKQYIDNMDKIFEVV